MSDENSSAPETRVGQNPVYSVELGMGEDKPKAKVTPTEGISAEFDDDGVQVHESDKQAQGRDKPASEGQGGADGEEGGQEGDQGGEEASAASHDLPAFDPSNQEVVQQYETSYLGKDGEPNLDSLASVWLKSAKRDASGNVTGALPDDVYKFLDQRGYSKDLVKSVEAGQIALLQQSEQALYARAGGQQHLQAAMEWGKKGGYTQAQRQRFNAIINGTDREAAIEQVDLLMQRYGAATGNGRRPVSRVNPRRSVAASASASGQGDGGLKPYANYEEYKEDLRKAQKEGNQKLLNENRARLKVSKWYTGGK